MINAEKALKEAKLSFLFRLKTLTAQYLEKELMPDVKFYFICNEFVKCSSLETGHVFRGSRTFPRDVSYYGRRQIEFIVNEISGIVERDEFIIKIKNL